MKPSTHKSLLGLAFEDHWLKFCVLRRSGGQVIIEKNIKLPLTLDPQVTAPELLGRELREKLDQSGISERHCALVLPFKWALTASMDLPPLEPDDQAAFIALQAEKSFPYSPEDLVSAVSCTAGVAGPRQATVLALPRLHLTNLQAALKAAGLRPLTITLDCASLPEPHPPSTILALSITEGGLDLFVQADGGIVLARSLGRLKSGDIGELDIPALVREVRMTLGRLPQPLLQTITSLQIYGSDDAPARLAEELRAPLAGLGLSVNPASRDLAGQPASPAEWSAAAAICAGLLLGRPSRYHFLEPRISPLQRLARRFSARRTLYIGAAAAAILLVTATAFFLQNMRLHHLEQQWSAMKPQVEQVEETQRKVRLFRAWFDPSIHSLDIVSRLTAAFPSEGTVWIKNIEVKDLSQVACSGSARGNRDWLAMLETLRKTPGIAELQVTQVKGEKPLQFSLSFRWQGDRDER